jgi:hypothetical protein
MLAPGLSRTVADREAGSETPGPSTRGPGLQDAVVSRRSVQDQGALELEFVREPTRSGLMASEIVAFARAIHPLEGYLGGAGEGEGVGRLSC